MTAWTNWSGRVECRPRAIERPASEDELAAIVRAAARDGLRVRVAGSGHSFTPIVATDGILVSLDALEGIESADLQALQATVRAGSKLHAIGAPLRELGMALANQGDVDVQSLGGAIGTGTHGTGRALGSISTQVIGLRLVAADGGIVEWSLATDPDEMAAARLSMGMLGIVTAVRMQLVAAYRLHEQVWRTGVDACMAELETSIATHRHFEFFWYPQRDRAELKTLDPTERLPSDVAGRKGERIGWSHEIFPSVRDQRFNEMEYALPAAAGPACFLELRERMQARHPDVVWPIEYRTLAADDIWLSPAHGRATVTLSLHQAAELPCDAFFHDLEAILRAHGGRPHWGKLHTCSADDLRDLYPRWDRFRALRGQLDPAGRYLNDYLGDLFARDPSGSPSR
jgi:FAD/FMN-containing dehydrogenase